MSERKIKLPTLDKYIDEKRQGEVFTIKSGNENKEKLYYIESYGCAMNFSDSEIVASILNDMDYGLTEDVHNAQLILINTCSIRDKAEQTIRKRLIEFNAIKRKKPGIIIGVLGCMAERLKDKFLEEEKIVDIVVGPDAYRDLPKLVVNAEDGERGLNVFLSREETYADISPIRLDKSGVTAFISIMRGCNNMCSFCVVPYTRGRERSRDPFSIVAEAQDLFSKGYREVTLLGQNVDSYIWTNPENGNKVSFANLLEMVANVNKLLRIRFSTSHPKDITDEVLYAIKNHNNICNYIHLPVQSGNSRILELMNRTYDADWYREKINKIYSIIPDCAVSSDFITGFCTETEEDHLESLEMIRYAKYSMSYMFYYSERPGTPAQKRLVDDVPLDVKKRRLSEVIEVQAEVSLEHNKGDIGKVFSVLIEGTSKKSKDFFRGRNSQNKVVIFPVLDSIKIGDYADVKVVKVTSATLIGENI